MKKRNNSLAINTWQFTAIIWRVWRHLPSFETERKKPCKHEEKRTKLENQLKNKDKTDGKYTILYKIIYSEVAIIIPKTQSSRAEKINKRKTNCIMASINLYQYDHKQVVTYPLLKTIHDTTSIIQHEKRTITKNNVTT